MGIDNDVCMAARKEEDGCFICRPLIRNLVVGDKDDGDDDGWDVVGWFRGAGTRGNTSLRGLAGVAKGSRASRTLTHVKIAQEHSTRFHESLETRKTRTFHPPNLSIGRFCNEARSSFRTVVTATSQHQTITVMVYSRVEANRSTRGSTR
jgi:hypothetical protein